MPGLQVTNLFWRFRGAAVGLIAAWFLGCGPAPAAEWRVMTVEGRCSWEAPGRPELKIQDIKTQRGPIRMTTYELKLERGTREFVVGVTDLPETIPEPRGDEIEQRLDGAQRASVELANSTLLDSKKISLDGYAGREFDLQLPGGLVVHQRVYLVRRTIYQLTARNVAPADAERFFAGFRLLTSRPAAGLPGDRRR